MRRYDVQIFVLDDGNPRDLNEQELTRLTQTYHIKYTLGEQCTQTVDVIKYLIDNKKPREAKDKIRWDGEAEFRKIRFGAQRTPDRPEAKIACLERRDSRGSK